MCEPPFCGAFVPSFDRLPCPSWKLAFAAQLPTPVQLSEPSGETNVAPSPQVRWAPVAVSIVLQDRGPSRGRRLNASVESSTACVSQPVGSSSILPSQSSSIPSFGTSNAPGLLLGSQSLQCPGWLEKPSPSLIGRVVELAAARGRGRRAPVAEHRAHAAAACCPKDRRSSCRRCRSRYCPRCCSTRRRDSRKPPPPDWLEQAAKTRATRAVEAIRGDIMAKMSLVDGIRRGPSPTRLPVRSPCNFQRKKETPTEMSG